MANSPKFKMKLTEICSQVGIHQSKGYSILHTLEPIERIKPIKPIKQNNNFPDAY